MCRQLQSNLIPGLNLNALGLFPGGTAAAVSPSMVPGPFSGPQAGYPSFGVSVSRSVHFKSDEHCMLLLCFSPLFYFDEGAYPNSSNANFLVQPIGMLQ